MTSEFIIQVPELIETDIGDFTDIWNEVNVVNGYIDMLTGTDLNSMQHSFVEQSTHILIIPEYTSGITDKMRVIDKNNRVYSIVYSDNPMEQDHHNEIYLKYSGDYIE